MREAGIGRLLVASLHQAIAEEIPARLEFYEHWLRPDRAGAAPCGRAPMLAVVGFLRTEGEAYHRVVGTAGRRAVEWTVPARGSWLARLLPPALASRLVVSRLARLSRQADARTRIRGRQRGGHGTITVSGSPFCDMRGTRADAGCGFYAAALSHLMAINGLDGEARTGPCVSVGHRGCVIEFDVRGRCPRRSEA